MWQKCTNCDGQGVKRVVSGNNFFRNIHTINCDRCSGRGKLPLNLCSTCMGNGTTREEEEFTFKPPSDIKPGQRINYPAFGNEIHNGITGDLFVGVELKPNQKFELLGDDLIYNTTINPIEVVVGKTVRVPHFDKELEVKIPKSANIYRDYIVRGKGMKRVYEYNGNLIIRLTLEVPEGFTEEQIETLKSLNEKMETKTTK